MRYSNADYASCRVDMKSTSETCHFLENCFVSWSFKKQNSVTLSTAKAEYIAAETCCAQVLWMKDALFDYELHYDHTKIFCDNTSTIHMAKNANQYSEIKYIEIRYHFLRYHYEQDDIEIDYVFTDFQLADIFTKSLDYNYFAFICGELNVCVMEN